MLTQQVTPEQVRAFLDAARAVLVENCRSRGFSDEHIASVLSDDLRVLRMFSIWWHHVGVQMFGTLWADGDTGKLHPEVRKFFVDMTDEQLAFYVANATEELADATEELKRRTGRGAKKTDAVTRAYELFVVARNEGLTGRKAWARVWAHRSMVGYRYKKDSIRHAVRARVRRAGLRWAN